MAICKTPYDTSAGLGYRYSHITQQLTSALVGGGLAVHAFRDGRAGPAPQPMSAAGSRSTQVAADHFEVALLEGGNSFADSVAFFKHPALVQHDGRDVVVLDVREFGKMDGGQREFHVRNVPEYVWAVKRAVLTSLWIQGHQASVRDISNLPLQVYCALVSECIQRRFALDPAEQATVAVIAGYFYCGLFSEDGVFDEDDKNQLAGKLARATSVEANRVFQIIDELGVVSDLHAFCEVVSKVVQNVALKNLNAGILVSVVGGNWYGSNSREVLSMALEHPPTWVLLVDASLHSATFKRSTLSKLASRFDRQGAATQLAHAVSGLLGGPGAVQDLPTYSKYFGSV